VTEELVLSVPYRPFVEDESARPYLDILVTGINGESGIISGLIDSGADDTSLPYGYAALMGYDESNLVPEEFGQVAGDFTAQRATVPSYMVVPQIPDLRIEFYPAFIEDSEIAIWGRLDFMSHFEVTIQEYNQVFTLRPIRQGDVTPSK
jgi:hypothetical protein